MHDVENLLTGAGFWVALAVGIVGVLMIWFRERAGHDDPGVMVVVTVACLVGLRVAHLLPAPLVVGVVLLVFGDWATRGRVVPATMVGVVPGALVLAAALPPRFPFWIQVVVVGSVVLGGVVVERADRHEPRIVPALLAVGALGVYFCVPDTETPKVLVAALVAGALVVVVPRARSTLGATAVTGLFVWIAAFGGSGRAGSVIGGIACLGVVLLVPAVRGRVHAIVLLVTQCVLVAYMARVAGFEDSAWSALALGLPAFALAGAVLVLARYER